MNLYDLRERGYDIATNWQECNTKSIFILNTNNIKKFLNYKRLASKRKCKYIICDIKFKYKIQQNKSKFFFYKNQNDLFEIAKIFYNYNDLKIIVKTVHSVLFSKGINESKEVTMEKFNGIKR